VSRIPYPTILGAVLLAMVAAGCASTGAVPKPSPEPGSHNSQGSAGLPGSEDSRDAIVNRQALVGAALALRGAPYRNGGTDPSGFDCSGFTQYVFARHGVTLPRGVREQFQTGRSVKTADLAPGDLLFFSTRTAGASHVGIAVGGDQFVHAPTVTGVVRVERLHSNYWARRFLGARRVIG
jgi:cell wall-associated NlpC family hydrolase